MKLCKGCGRVLDESSFAKNKNNRDGLQDKCRACFSEYNRKRYASRRGELRAKIYDYRAANPGKVLEARLHTCKAKPTKVNARRVVEAAVMCGALKRPTACQACGCSNREHRIEAHHSDYRKPMDVIWLCTPCHRRADIQRRKQEEKRGAR